MWGRGKKKIEEKKGKESEVKKEGRKKKEEIKGSPWTGLVILVVSVVLGAVFWVYGWLSAGGQPEVRKSGETSNFKEGMETRGSGGRVTEDGVIIFEK